MSLAVITVRVSHLVPEGQLYRVSGDCLCGPLTYWSMQHGGRYPFESRYSRGMLELERERRRYG